MGYSSPDKNKIRLPLHLVLIIPFVIIILVTVGLTDYIAIKNGQTAVNDLVARLATEIDSDVQEHLHVFLDEPFKINQVNFNALQNGHLNSSDTEKMANYFWQQGQIFTGLEAMGYGNDSGELAGANVHEKHMILTSPSQTGIVLRRYAVNDDGRRTGIILREVQNFDVHSREWYQAAVKARRPVWTQINPSLTLLRLDLSAVTPYYNTEGALQGVFYLDLSLSQLNLFLNNINISNKGKIIIMERNGLIVATSTPEQPYVINGTDIRRLNVSASSDPMIVHAAKYLKERFSSFDNISAPHRSGFDINGNRYFIQVSPYHDPRGLDWLVLIVIPESDFMGQINTGYKNTIMLITASVFLSIVVAVFVSRRVTRPLSNLSRSARALARGDYDQKLEIERSDEVGELANAFNSMAARLKENVAMLKMSEVKFRSLFEQSPIPIEVYDAQGKLVDANNACLEMFGITDLKYVLGFDLFVDPNIPPDAKQHLAKGETISFESVFDFDLVREKNLYPTSRSGICYIDCVIHPLLDMNNEFTGYIVHVRDITKRKRAEEDLRKSEEMFHLIFEKAPIGLAYFDANGTVTECNELMAKIIGSPKEKIIGINMPKTFKDIRQKAALGEALKGNIGFFEGEYVSVTGGKTGYIRTIYAPIFSADRSIMGGISITEDISERRKAEEKLIHAHDLMQYIISHAQSAIAVHDKDLKYVYVSEQYLKQYKVKEKDVIGKHHYEVFPDLPQKWRDVHQRALAGEVSSKDEDPYAREDGSVDWTRWECRPWYESDGSIGGIIVYTEVITERKLKEEALRASLEEKTVLLNEIHHRVKNNLQIVSSLLSLQSMRTKNKEALDTLRETGNRVYTMALLHETLYRSGNMAKVSFSSYIENICYHIIHSYGAESNNIKLEQHLADITLDLDQAVPCGLIITELVSNALKHAFQKGQKGRITVELQEIPDKYILLKVADDGIGLPPGLDISQSETLGLKLVSMLTEKLNGNVEIIRNKGTTFLITFKAKND